MVIRLPHAELELHENAQGQFLGFGTIQLDGVSLRDGRTPLALRLDTPEGILYTTLVRREIREAGGGVDLVLDAHGCDWGRCDYMDDYEQSLIVPSRPEAMVDEIIVSLRPVSRTIRERVFHGFSLGFRFRSDTRQIHRLLLRGTWELGGTLDGTTVLSQGQCNMPVYTGGAEGLFTTTCLNTLERYGDPCQVSYQMGVRGGLVQPFDFEFSAQGALFAWWPEQDQVCSWSESPPGDHRLHVADEWRFPLAGDVTVPPKEILFHAGELADHDARNLWWSARELVYGALRERFDVAPTPARPEVTFKYETEYVDTPAGRRLKMKICGQVVPHEELLYAIGDLVLPRLAKVGIKRFHCEFVHESDVTVLGDKCKLEDGVHGGMFCSSVCATHRFFPSDFWGGIQAFRYMADKAHDLGMEIGSWFAPHFSPRSPYFVEHPEWKITGPATHPNSAGYTFASLISADWNTPIYDAVLADLTRWHKEGGLDYLWNDSFSNLGVGMVNYRERMRPNFSALGRLYSDLQKVGIRSFGYESLSPWGMPQFSIMDLRGDLTEEKGAVPGQNDFAWYLGNEDMLVSFNAGIHARKRDDEELQRIQFKAHAGGACVDWKQKSTPAYQYDAWYGELNRAYETARPFMQYRTLLPEDQGVCWQGGNTTVMWTFQDNTIDVPPEADVEVLHGAPPDRHSSTSVALPAWGVYRISQTLIHRETP